MYGIGLKTLIAEAAPAQQSIVALAIGPKLLTALQNPKKVRLLGGRLARHCHSTTVFHESRPISRPRHAAAGGGE